MTEEEAKTKMCFRAATFGASQQLADGPGPHCIGSACMAFRWHYVELSEDGQRRDTWPDLAPFGPADQRLKRHGYCGLAGDPPPMPPAGKP
jgi:hypothetical protein